MLARLEVRLRDGTILEEAVEHARGSAARPLTDDELLTKVQLLVEPVLLGSGASTSLADAVFSLDGAAGCDALLGAAVPRVGTRA